MNQRMLRFEFTLLIVISAVSAPSLLAASNKPKESVVPSVAEAMVVSVFESDEERDAFELEHGQPKQVDGAGLTSEPSPDDKLTELVPSWESWTSPERLAGNIRLVAVMAVLSLAPALLLMTTCYVRIVVVLSLLRQALGSQQLPPNQVTTTLAMFLTGLIMWPVWTQVHEDAVKPYTDPEVEMSADEAWIAGVAPVREFMGSQIWMAGNQDDVRLFLDYLGESEATTLEDVPLQALLPAFLVSELKVAFLIGFLVFLPFVIIDLVVASVTMSMGMVMVPPTTVSLPLKLMLFVLVDGWHLVVETLLMSFQVN